MLPQQQNPHAVSCSLQQQQIDSKEMNSEGSEEDVKTFSIRQYVFACRQKGLLQSWPFPEKYLQMCLDRGMKKVLPPFGLRSNNNTNNSVSELSSSSHNGIIIPNLNDPCDDQDYDANDKNVRVLKSESLPDHHGDPLELMKKQNIMNLSDSGLLKSNNEEISKAMMTTISPPDCVKKSSQVVKCSSGKLLDRRRRKGRCKKRSMAEILAEAKHCSLEEINRINQFSYAAIGNIIDQGYYYHDETAPHDENNGPKST